MIDIPLRLYEPTILDCEEVLNFRKLIFDANQKFDGTNNLDKYDDYIDWLANVINTSKKSKTYDYHPTFIAKYGDKIIGIVEIFYNTSKNLADIIENINPLEARKGYGMKIIRLAINECISYGIKKDNITYKVIRK